MSAGRALIVAAIVAPVGTLVAQPSIDRTSVVAVGNFRTGPLYTETTVTANPAFASEALVAFNKSLSGGGVGVYYSATNDGGTMWSLPAIVPAPSPECGNGGGFDPMSAASVYPPPGVGRLMVGALNQTTSNWHNLFVARKQAPNSSGLDTLAAIPPGCDQVVSYDRGSLALGPAWTSNPASPVEVAFCGFVSGATPVLVQSLSTSTPAGQSWPAVVSDVATALQGTLFGQSPHAAILRIPVVGNGWGRIVLAYRDLTANSAHGLPVAVTYSDTGGSGLWANRLLLNQYGPGGVAIESLGNTAILPGFYAQSDPSVSVDPRNGHEAEVYVAFVATVTGIRPANSDVFIARSTNGGLSFDPMETYRLLDSQLCPECDDGTISQESMPSIAIDESGGINLLFARTATLPGSQSTKVSIRYAHFQDVTALGGSPDFLVDLTPSYTAEFSIGQTPNDFQTITSAGCYVYAAYCSRPSDSTSEVDVCVTRISLCPPTNRPPP